MKYSELILLSNEERLMVDDYSQVSDEDLKKFTDPLQTNGAIPMVAVNELRRREQPLKHYYITLRMFIGEIEKTSKKIVDAPDEKTARIEALIGECHFGTSYEDDQEKDQECWDGGQYVYNIKTVKEITPEQKKQLFEITGDYSFL
jgi:hypothetical protein